MLLFTWGNVLGATLWNWKCSSLAAYYSGFRRGVCCICAWAYQDTVDVYTEHPIPPNNNKKQYNYPNSYSNILKNTVNSQTLPGKISKQIHIVTGVQYSNREAHCQCSACCVNPQLVNSSLALYSIGMSPLGSAKNELRKAIITHIN